MNLNKDRYKTANKNVNRLTIVFERQDTRWKQEVKRMCLNGVTCRETHQVKKVKELQYAHRSFSVLINNIIYYHVYECFGQ